MVLTWCWNAKKNVAKTDTQTWTQILSQCSDFINQYLQNADLIWTWDKVVAKWDTVIVDYIWRLNKNEVFDTSVENIAVNCWLYQSWRNYNEWLKFQAWAGQMIAGFDNAVVGMKVWQTKTVTIPSDQAYGKRDETKLIKVDRAKIPDAEKYKVGDIVASAYWQKFKVYAVTDQEITFDANHELAGKDLIFDITIKAINN